MRIMHVLNSSSFSGAESIVISVIKNSLNEKNVYIYVSQQGDIEQRLREENVEYEMLPKLSVKNLRKAIKKIKPDLIHAHDFRASIVSSIAKVGTNIKLISHIHKNDSKMKKINIYSITYLLSTICYKKVLLVSETIKKEYIFSKFINKKIEILSNPIDVELVRKKAEQYKINEEFDVLYLGRLSAEKDPVRYIEIIKNVQSRIHDIKCAMIGDGPERDKCIDLINKNNLEATIKILGFKKNPYPILKKSKILCITSKFEGFGLVAAEALTLGKPIVATNIGGLPAIIDDSCGKLCNKDEEFINEILKLLNDKKYYNSKSKNTDTKLKRLSSIKQYIIKLNKIYLSIIDK